MELLLTLLFLWAEGAQAANVNPDTGYTNAFSSLPLAADFSQTSVAGAPTDLTNVLGMDTAVAALTAGGITAPLSSQMADPPDAQGAPMWTSGGSSYMVTRPTANKGNVILGTFVNNTGTNATAVHLSYDYRTVSPVAEQVGVRGYYSFTGLAASWVNVASLSPGTTTNGSFSRLAADLNLTWNHGATLYLLWMDDNGSDSPDTACEYDNFSITVTAGTPVPAALAATVIAPAHGALAYSDTQVVCTGAVYGGTAPYRNTFYTNFNSTGFAVAGTVVGASPTLDLGLLPAGSYEIYLQAQDATGATTNSFANSFTVSLRPLGITLSAPADNRVFDVGASIWATGTVAAGTGPYTVKFWTNSGTGPYAQAGNDQVGSGPQFTQALGSLPATNYSIYATVTDRDSPPSSATSPTNRFTVQPDTWAAYNDHSRGTGTAPNVSSWGPTSTASPATYGGPLTNFTSGSVLNQGVSIAVVGALTSYSSVGIPPNAGRPADDLFSGKVDWAGGGPCSDLAPTPLPLLTLSPT